MTDPFHAGEKRIQVLTGERQQAERNGRLIDSCIPRAAMRFLSQQSFCVLGSVSGENDIWATFLVGHQGFASSDESGRILSFDLSDRSGVFRYLPPLTDLSENDYLGLIFIDLLRRRRLRVNGRVAAVSSGSLTLHVAEAFPNCPKYIQKRQLLPADPTVRVTKIDEGEELTEGIKKWIAAADTFFVASAHPGGPVDTSHRGGKTGFVQVAKDRLRVPDYPGNSMFGTLGNFAANPRAGLVFIDFDNNRQLQITGDIKLDLSTSGDIEKTGGTRRWWVFLPRKWIVSAQNYSFDGTLIDASPFNP